MKREIGKLLSNLILSIRQKTYNDCYAKNTITYDMWINKLEEEDNAIAKQDAVKMSMLQAQLVSYEELERCLQKLKKTWKNGAERNGEADVLICTAQNGRLTEHAEEYVLSYFAEHPSIMLLYGDEDIKSPEGIRYTPWFKPDWSPDTFLSCFYFGSMFAVRVQALREQFMEKELWQSEAPDADNIYRLCQAVADASGGFLRRGKEGFPVGHIEKILYSAASNLEMMVKTANQTALSAKERGSITIVIPSKDNGDILFRCIRSLEHGLGQRDEIIVVDNGSNTSNREAVSSFLAARGMRYLYKEMPFHFSVMCNLGAESAKGNVLLFLNDDVEIGSGPKEFLNALYRQAVTPYTGAVGVKLLYPESDTIQHAGIVNQHLGPVHKLQFQKDNISYYYGFNRGCRNVLAVTGACLAVERDKFLAAGGFCTKLAHSFNDVDLCFTLYEAGYYQTVLQNVTVYHHESLSRGGADDIPKNNRLYHEKDILYERHKELAAQDPFYHKYLVSDVLSTGFETAAEYEYVSMAANGSNSRMKRLNGLPGRSREDACVMASIEYAGSLRGWTGGGDGYYVQGYVFVAGSDNARYDKYLILRKEKELWSLKPLSLLRRDVEENLPDQQNVGMAGFAAKFSGGGLEQGDYEIGLLLRDCCNGFGLVHFTNRLLHIERHNG